MVTNSNLVKEFCTATKHIAHRSVKYRNLVQSLKFSLTQLIFS
jgi:hypothetical protein